MTKQYSAAAPTRVNSSNNLGTHHRQPQPPLASPCTPACRCYTIRTPVNEMTTTDLLSITNLTRQEVQGLLSRASAFKMGAVSNAVAGKSVALLFEKPSLRTRLSFDLAVHQLGGHPIYLGPDEVDLGRREPVADVARVLERQVDCIVARTFAHSTLVELAEWASVPVINALSDGEHPCQALADLLTIQEHAGGLHGTTVAFIGDGNNVAASLALGTALAGASFVIASPPGYQLPESVLARAQKLAAEDGATVRQVVAPQEAVRDADVVYTDVWTSMGQETEAQERRLAFQGYQVGPELLALAKQDAIFMHDLPAHPGEEIAQGMLEHPQCVAFQQAENKLHMVKAVLEMLLGQTVNP